MGSVKKALSVAINIGVMLAVSLAIDAIAKGIDNLVHADEKAIEKANEITSAWKEQNKKGYIL